MQIVGAIIKAFRGYNRTIRLSLLRYQAIDLLRAAEFYEREAYLCRMRSTICRADLVLLEKKCKDF